MPEVTCPLIEQLVTLGQLIEVRGGWSRLDGSASAAQVEPPSVLERTSPELGSGPSVPIAKQIAADGQVASATEFTSEGSVAGAHELPPLLVTRTSPGPVWVPNGVPVPSIPTARHDVALEQLIEMGVSAGSGKLVVDQLPPSLVVSVKDTGS
jgi:hypothetical protein